MEAAPSTGRRAWLDTLKTLLICLVIVIHGVLSYAGTVEVWTYSEFREVTLSLPTEAILFVLVVPLGLVMMPLLFLVSGLVAAPSMARRGPAGFARDRLVRLGIPFAVFALLLQPTLTYLMRRSIGRDTGTWAEEFLGTGRLDTGPAWFVGVLLIFSLAYAALVRLAGRDLASARPVTLTHLLTLAAAVAAASWAVRLHYSYGSEAGASDLNFWEWPACLAAFTVGVASSGGPADGSWLDGVPAGLARRCRTVTVAALVAMTLLVVAAGMAGRIPALLGGPGPWAVAFAVVEAPLVVCGPVWLVGVAQRTMGRRWRGDAALSRLSYAAFLLQGIPLLALAVLLRPVAAPAEVKALAVAAGGLVGSFGLAWVAVRLPGLRRAL
ncbi:acyltransferase family protein [Tessaracoccus sp. G1721]